MAIQLPANATQAQTAYGDLSDYKTTWSGKNDDRNKYRAEVSHDWAMFLANAELENQQWERGNEYNLPVNEYVRLIEAGMNPLLAMQAIAGHGNSGVGASQVAGSPSARTGSTSEMAQAARAGNAINAAGSLASSLNQLAQGRNAAITGDYLPTTIQNSNDLNAAKAYLDRMQGDVVKDLAKSTISANAAREKYHAASAELANMKTSLERQLVSYQSAKNSWFQLDKQREYVSWWQDLQESVSRIGLQSAQAGAAKAAAAQSYSQAALNDATRTQVIPAQVELMGKQGLLYDRQGELVDMQTFNTAVQAVAGRIENMHKATGMPYNCIGALVVEDADAAGVFDAFGKQIKNHSIIEGNSIAGRVINQWQTFDDSERQSANSVAKFMVTKQYIDAGGQIVNSAVNAVGAAAGAKNAFDPATRSFMNVTPPQQSMPTIGFTSP